MNNPSKSQEAIRRKFRLLLTSQQSTLIIVISSAVGFIILTVIAGLFYYYKYYKPRKLVNKRGVNPNAESRELSIKGEEDSVLSTPRKENNHGRIHNPIYDTANVKKKIVKIFSEEEDRDHHEDDRELRIITIDCGGNKHWREEEKEVLFLRRQESKIRERVRVDGEGYHEDEEKPQEMRYMSNNTVNLRIKSLDRKEVN